MSKFFQRRQKLHEPIGRVQFVVFEKNNLQVLIYSKLREKNLLINNKHEKIRDG